ncbi:30S ribosomal protein S6 [Catalinimonas niigatensis]|uniref:30S ribosomal protein S6 n=1 Tax=Catalinimonas niigatensis TaxID=1397264 RepID=UPI0026654547|nr:30S ribosomal protein S6 [Catalinimonas niigatensis]WPP52070.1 30S ribosomal protein S6 [Catalinimonas niigatensis]
MEFKNNYETVFILNPVLSEDQMKDTANKFVQILKDNGADVINVEHWGLRKLAYPIHHKTTGFYNLVEFSVEGSAVATLETEFRRDDRIMRFLTVALDKHAVDYNERRRKGEFKRRKETKEESAS